MLTLNMHEAKSSLSRLVAAVEDGTEQEIVISRNGKPAAMLVPYRKTSPAIRLGLAKGKFTVPDDFDEPNEGIERLFMGKA